MKRSPTLFVSLALAVVVLAGLACGTGGAAVYGVPLTPTAQPTQTDTATPTRAAPTQPPTPTQPPGPTRAATPTQAPQGCFVSAEALHVRACAGVACPVLDWLPQGAPITPTGEISGAWWALAPAGWINAEWITCP